MSSLEPSAAVLAAFGTQAPPEPLGGGQEKAWRSGEIVLKPLDMPEAGLAWQAELFATLTADGFRIALPLRATDGSLVVEGWCGWEALVDGRHEDGRWREIIGVGRAAPRGAARRAAAPLPRRANRSVGDRRPSRLGRPSGGGVRPREARASACRRDAAARGPEPT